MGCGNGQNKASGGDWINLIEIGIEVPKILIIQEKIFFWNMWSYVKNNFNGINFGRKGFRVREDVMEVKSEDSSEKKSEEKSEERTERWEESLEKISVKLKSEKLMLR